VPRPRGPARTQLLDAAVELLLDRGFEAAALDDVCTRAGVTKGALFYHFESKEALAAAAVAWFFEGLVADGASVSPPADPVDALGAYLDGVVALLQGDRLRHGCLLGAMAMQTPTTHPMVAEAAQRALADWRTRIAGLIDAAATHRGVAVKPRELADGLLAAIEGGLLLDRGRATNASAVAAVRHYGHYLDLILDPGGEP
jgi:TetR/AcrR family transcriptional repressor of nem operon